MVGSHVPVALIASRTAQTRINVAYIDWSAALDVQIGAVLNHFSCHSNVQYACR